MQKNRDRARKGRGSGLAEAAVAATFLIPLALGMLDIIFIVLANSINDSACKNAARAAANQSNGGLASQAALKSLASFQPSQIIPSIKLVTLDIPPDKSSVACQTQILVKLPVPVPGHSEITFMARAIEPIVVKQDP